MYMENNSLFLKNWKILLIIVISLILIIIFIWITKNSSVSPDVTYFPT